ncbi:MULTISPECIES: ABC transporter substrate-binding protein [Achromobacter]|uniref:Twin-arginine translocation pathway signal n=1 Tax=Achromobacter spanius TaxID=217203 RepID=A0AAW3IH09_9BURK|nr:MULTISPECIES: ABC transporter substrate-binding protein [Achromobacter]KNE29573.1 twin-arginine translocation pathway signal [Achromobacter spanius]MCD0499833.1 ABC transporter substrate-binding protein [Achromobacter sp. MY14]MCW3152906.1 ABC transporter substrate-binding protein [Achromobacter spanius]
MTMQQTWRRMALRVGACALLGYMAGAQAADTPKQGGTLRYGTVSEVVSLDPHVYGGSAWKVLIESLYSPLAGYDKTGAVVPRLAERWEQPDARSIIFHLRPNVKFQDGTPLTADDVKFSLDRILDPATGATLRANLLGMKVTVVDPATVKVEKPSPDATLLGVLALPEAAIVSRKWVEGGANLKLAANGTGPFQLKAYEPAVRASLARNPAYFVAGQPYLDAVDFRMIKSDDARVNALRSGSLDMIDFVPWKDIDALRRNAGMKIDMAGGAFMSVWFNTSKKPFDDARVRRAVSYAIDREAVSKAAFFGHGQPIHGAPTPTDSPYYNKALDGTYKRDVKQARALLAEAGYGNGLDASMVVFQGLGIYTTMAQVVQANLKEAGINLKLEPVEWATLVERKNRGDYESMIYGVSVKLPDPDAYAYYLGGDSSYWAKPIGYRDPELEKLLAEGRALTDPKARQPVYAQVEKRILDTSPWAFVNWREQAQGYLRKVRGYTQLGGALSESSPGISLPTMWLN